MAIKIPAQSSVPTPSSGSVRIFFDGTRLCFKDDSGTVRCLAEGVTREEVEDLLQNSFSDTTTITWVYNDTSNQFEASIESSTLTLIVNAVQPGDNVSELVNDANYVDLATAAAAAPVQSVNGQTGAVILDKADVGLSNIDNTSDVNKPVSTAQALADTAVQNFSIQRSNHTGTQTASTISDFNAAVDNAETVTSLSVDSSGTQLTFNDEDGIANLVQTNVFGSEFEDFESTTQVNFSGAIANRRSYTTASKPAGRYRVAIQIQTEPSATGSNDLWQLRVNGVQIGRNFENEAKDTGGDIRNLIYIVGYYQHTSAGTFDIQIWGGTEGGTCELNGDVAEVWRVS